MNPLNQSVQLHGETYAKSTVNSTVKQPSVIKVISSLLTWSVDDLLIDVSQKVLIDLHKSARLVPSYTASSLYWFYSCEFVGMSIDYYFYFYSHDKYELAYWFLSISICINFKIIYYSVLLTIVKNISILFDKIYDDENLLLSCLSAYVCTKCVSSKINKIGNTGFYFSAVCVEPSTAFLYSRSLGFSYSFHE